MVGIPARNEARTVAAVAAAADAGLTQFCAGGRNLIVLADNGSTDGTTATFLAAKTRTPQQVIQTGAAGTGKGTNVFALVEAALDRNVDRLILFDADVQSTEPAWVGRFADATDDAGTPTLATPIYRRDRYEAEVTNHVARPLVAALFGRPLQQPIGGDFALNRALMLQLPEWRPRPASASVYGIDIWLTASALREGCAVAEVTLGRKVHRPGFPKVFYLPLQVLDSLFHVALPMGRPRPPLVSPLVERPAVTHRAVPQDPVLLARVGATVADYLTAHRTEVARMFPTARDLPAAPWGLRIGGQDWPHLLADAVEILATGRFQVARDHMIALYINRALTFWEDVAHLASADVDSLLDDQTSDTVEAVAKRSINFGPVRGPINFDRGYWDGIELVESASAANGLINGRGTG